MEPLGRDEVLVAGLDAGAGKLIEDLNERGLELAAVPSVDEIPLDITHALLLVLVATEPVTGPLEICRDAEALGFSTLLLCVGDTPHSGCDMRVPLAHAPALGRALFGLDQLLSGENIIVLDPEDVAIFVRSAGGGRGLVFYEDGDAPFVLAHYVEKCLMEGELGISSFLAQVGGAMTTTLRELNRALGFLVDSPTTDEDPLVAFAFGAESRRDESSLFVLGIEQQVVAPREEREAHAALRESELQLIERRAERISGSLDTTDPPDVWNMAWGDIPALVDEVRRLRAALATRGG
jgi:hypothetical protein